MGDRGYLAVEGKAGAGIDDRVVDGELKSPGSEQSPRRQSCGVRLGVVSQVEGNLTPVGSSQRKMRPVDNDILVKSDGNRLWCPGTHSGPRCGVDRHHLGRPIGEGPDIL